MRVIDPWLDAEEPAPNPRPAPPPPETTQDEGRGYGELTVDEMVDGHEDDAPLGERLDAIRHTESDSGVTVTVDLYGGLVDLVLGPPAMRLRAPELAATVQRLATMAATAARTEAMAVLTTRHPNHPLLTHPTS